MMKRTIWVAAGVMCIVAITATACGGSSSTPTAPTTGGGTSGGGTTGGGNSGGGTGGSGTVTDSATITIGADGRVSPSTVTILRGGRVTMLNNHNSSHDMSSDPHPEHTQCPEINQIGFLTSGQSRTSGNFNTARTCGFHDHNLPQNTGLQGTIIIQ